MEFVLEVENIKCGNSDDAQVRKIHEVGGKSPQGWPDGEGHG